MSYTLSLDEMSEGQLIAELQSRMNSRRRGECDYCHRRPSTPACRMTERHNHKDIRPSAACITCSGTGSVPCPCDTDGDGDCARCAKTGRHWCDHCQAKGIEPT